MEKVLISKAAALEIFCLAALKVDLATEDDLTNIENVKTLLRKIKGKHFHLMSQYVFGEDISGRLYKDGRESEPEADFFRDLKYAIKDGQPVTFNKAYVPIFQRKLGIDQIVTIDLYSNLADQLEQWVNSHWVGYFFSEKRDSKSRKMIAGITRVLIHFLPFGKVRIDSYYVRENITQNYYGSYDTYGESDKDGLRHFLKLDLKLLREGTFQKDLHILFHVAKKNPILSLGQWNNVGRDLSSGTILIERLPKGIDLKKYEPKFIEHSLIASEKAISSYVGHFFDKKANNALDTPFHIHDENSLYELLDRNSPN